MTSFLECVHLQGNNFPEAAFLLLILSSNQFHIILLMSSHRMSSSISMLSSHEITIGYRIGEYNQISNNAAYAPQFIQLQKFFWRKHEAFKYYKYLIIPIRSCFGQSFT